MIVSSILVRDGYDIAIRGGRIVDSSLITRPVCQLNTVCLLPRQHYLSQHGVPQCPDDFVRTSFARAPFFRDE